MSSTGDAVCSAGAADSSRGEASETLSSCCLPDLPGSVERRLMGRVASALLSRLSVLPCRERGGVRGEARSGRSVGRRAAGMYMGDFGGRIWR